MCDVSMFGEKLQTNDPKIRTIKGLLGVKDDLLNIAKNLKGIV